MYPSLLSLRARAAAAMSVSPVTVSADASAGGRAIAEDYLGLSFESQLLLPDGRGRRYFDPDNSGLVRIFRALGIKNLRVGGNTSDNPAVAIPGPADIDDLFGFARQAGVKVIYGLRLRGQPDPRAAAETARYIHELYSDELDSFAIGNEPSIFVKTYPDYREKWNAMMAAVTAAVPDAVFCGPSDFTGDWICRMTDEHQRSGRLKTAVCHMYAGLNARDVQDPEAERQRILSPQFVELYKNFSRAFVPHLLGRKMPYRMGETNSHYNGGAAGVSDTFAAALWGLDYLYWWASHGAAGLNFHTGDRVAAGDDSTSCRYAVYWSAHGGYDVHPLGYAVKAFDLGGHGRFVPVAIESAGGLNLPVYAVLGAGGVLYLTLINKEHGPAGRYAAVSLACGNYSQAEVAYLMSPGGDVAATGGITLAESGIGPDGRWNGVWRSLISPDSAGRFALELPLATAAIVRLIP